VVRLRSAHAGESVARVQDVLRPAGPVEPERVPLRARPVVAQEQNERVVEFAVRLQVIENAADVAVHALDYRGVDRHAAREVSPAVGGEGVPSWVLPGPQEVGPGRIRGPRRERDAALREQAEFNM
jgi:hypothetical protein